MKGLLLILLLSMGSTVQASENCPRTMQQLGEMQKAQALLLKSLVQKNLNTSAALSSFARRLEVQKKQNRPVGLREISGLRQSSQDFLSHHQRELELIRKFEEASKEVIAQAQKCLQQDRTRMVQASQQEN